MLLNDTLHHAVSTARQQAAIDAAATHRVRVTARAGGLELLAGRVVDLAAAWLAGREARRRTLSSGSLRHV